ncbi:tetratricopeptide repeat protein [Actinoplanes sp. GCM10030250]|uniref:tetratricopeptide repeat protein n=1 Tax=Actinoplanes sp. GCM10030250 TaxID=3273376 RepID=UPI00360A0ED6
MAEPDSLLDILRRRKQAWFVGRDGHIGLFRENFRLPVERKRFIFNIHGDGGVGKTFLLQQLRRIAREEGAVDAYTDEHIYGVPETMAALAGQLGKPFNDFLSKYEDFDRRREQMAQDPQAPLTAWSKVTRAAVKIGLNASKALPGAAPIVELVDAEAAAEATDQVRVYLSAKFSDSRDVRLLLNPVEELTPLFLQGLRKAATQQSVALFFDTYERTAPVLDGWLLDILHGRFGDPPTALVLTVAGRDPLGASGWTEFLGAIAAVPLLPFTETETRQLLAARAVTSEQVVRTVWTLSGGLPLLVAMLAEGHPTDPDEVGDPSGTAVERFLKWEHDPRRREAVMTGALPRRIDADVLSVLAPDLDGRATLDWLKTLPFVATRSGRFEYHDVVRAPMVRMQRVQSAQNWRAAHRQLAEAHEQWRQQVRADADWSDSAWLHHRLEETYHGLCADPSGKLSVALESAVDAAVAGIAIIRRWAEMIRMAGHDAGNDRVQQRGQCLVACLDEQRPDCVDVLTELLHDSLLSSDARSAALVERGRLHYYADRDEKSITDFSEAIRLDPDRSVAYERRGESHRWLKRYEQALADFDRAIELDPKSDWAIASRGETYHAMERYEQALADFDRAIELNPKSDWAIASRGETYHAMERYEQALADFDRAIELNPKSDWATAGRGLTYRAMERYEQALADFDRAIDLDPESSWAIASRGETYHAMERYELALADFDRAIELDPRYFGSVVGRGLTYRAMERYEQALADFDRAIDLDPESSWAIASRGETYRAMERYEQALADFGRAIDLDPESSWAIASRGRTYHMMADYEQALADFDRAIELDPKYFWAMVGRGLTYRPMKRYEQALADFNRAIDLDPESSWAIASRGRTYRAMKRYEQALADFDRAIDLNPKSDWAIAGRGETYRLMKCYEQALTDLDKAIELDPNDAWYLAYRWRANCDLHRAVEAEADLARATAIDPSRDWGSDGTYEGHEAP